jgi:hypothetical protein
MASALPTTIRRMVRGEALDEPLEAVLASLKEIAAGVPNGATSGAARDNAERRSGLTNTARTLIEARAKLPSD